MVGPRPERPELIEKNCMKIPEFAYRTRVKAGLPVMRRFTENTIRLFIDKLKLDLIYVSNYSILMDIHLIFSDPEDHFLSKTVQRVSEKIVKYVKAYI